MDLRLLIHLQLAQFIVHIDDRLRLDKKRRPASALVMDDPRNRGFVLLLDRDHIAAIAHGHDRVLQQALVPGGIQDLVHLRL